MEVANHQLQFGTGHGSAALIADGHGYGAGFTVCVLILVGLDAGYGEIRYGIVDRKAADAGIVVLIGFVHRIIGVGNAYHGVRLFTDDIGRSQRERHSHRTSCRKA